MSFPDNMFEGEDLFEQLSTELDLPELMDDQKNGDAFLNELMQDDSILGHEPTFKSEPFSPQLPPSPSGSEHSDSSNSRLSNAPLSPPYSPSTILLNQQAQPMVTVTSNDLINYKIPIPKVTKPPPPKPTIVTATQRPLVLTSAQLAQLTQTGILNPPSVTVKTEAVSPLTTAVPTIQTISSCGQVQQQPEMDMKTLKRQQRMIKNRESACLSRKKKKEYVTNLEEQLNCLGKENRDLRAENETLKARVRELESEKTLWTDSVLNSSSGKKATALFAVLLLVTLNLKGLNYNNHHNFDFSQGILKSKINEVSKSDAFSRIRHGGRSLLWEDEQQMNNNESFIPSVNSSSPVCPMYFNQSESIRLDNQLRGWFKKDEKKIEPQRPAAVATTMTSTSLESYKRKRPSFSASIYHMLIADNEAADDRRKAQRSAKDPSGGEITLYDSGDVPRFSYESFFEAIERRDDTFYVVSFSGDHLLLPASAHNQTSRPRMSLLLPSVAVSLNGESTCNTL